MIGITVADISIRFPEIMEEEYKDLIEYLNDNHIVFEINDNKDLQQRIDKAIELLEPFVEIDLCTIKGKMLKPAIEVLKNGGAKMEETKELHCSECGAKIEDNYYKCLDNCLQVNFFDTEEENCFCSEECFCKYMSLEQLDVEDDEDEI